VSTLLGVLFRVLSERQVFADDLRRFANGLVAKLRRPISHYVAPVFERAGVSCCVFGGGKRFVVPELNAHVLTRLRSALAPDYRSCVSTNRTFQIGLTAETDHPCRAVDYVREECAGENEEADLRAATIY
jgi:D-lactate dehydrogenase